MCPWELFLTNETNLEWRLDVLGKINSPQMRFLNGAEAIANEKRGMF